MITAPIQETKDSSPTDTALDSVNHRLDRITKHLQQIKTRLQQQLVKLHGPEPTPERDRIEKDASGDSVNCRLTIMESEVETIALEVSRL